MRRLSSRPGFVPTGLSRVQFLGGSAALLAGCSAGRAVPPLGGSLEPHSTDTKVLNLSSKELPKRPKRKTGIVISTSSSGKAVAAHDSHGKFLMSLAMGPAFLRARAANGQTFVFAADFRVANALNKPTFLSTGHVVRFKQSPSNGRMYMRLQDGAGPTAFHIPNTTFALEGNGSVTMFKGRGKRAKPYANTGAPRKLHSKADVDALLAAVVDRPGAWTADDDFVGAEGQPDEGFRGTRPPKAVGKRSLGTRRTQGDSSCTATTTSTSSTFTFGSSTFNSGSFGSSGFYSSTTGEYAIEAVRRASAERRASGMSAECAWLIVDMVVGLAAMGISTPAVLAGCITPLGLVTLGGSCLLALAAWALSYYGYFRGATQYVNNTSCPLPPGVHRP
jgi:hypothetical protein